MVGAGGNVSIILELMRTFICYVLGKKDVICLKEFTLAADKGGMIRRSRGSSVIGYP